MRSHLAKLVLTTLMLATTSLLTFAGLAFLTTPARAQGTVLASDNFNRADEVPFAVGGNWGKVTAGNYPGSSQLVGNRVRNGNNEGIYYWQGAGSFDPTRQFARETVVQKDGEMGLVLCGGPNQAIMINWGPPGTTKNIYIYWYAGGADQGVLSVTPTTLSNGDIVEASLENGTITVKDNGVVVATTANTTTLTTGSPGFITYGDPAQPTLVGILDDWQGGLPTAYTIGGTITESAVGLSGVLVTASGGFSGSATTNASGVYSIAGVPPGATGITLTPTLAGHTMSPTTRSVTGPVNANVTGQDFTSTLIVTRSISGTITENATGLSGVLVTASGGYSGSATTNGSGAYTITGVPNGATGITLTPTLAGHTMSPTTRTVAGPVNANVTGQDFTSTLIVPHSISGTITESAVGLSGVLVTASGGYSGSATTNGSGVYTITGVPNGATGITLTPTLAGHTMSPTTRTVTGPVNANVTGQDFTSTLIVPHSISGTITESATGLAGVLVTASGGYSGSATTNGSGVYTITGVPDGTTGITLTPTLAGHTLSPTTRTVTGPVNANVTGQDFTSTLDPLYSISGTITENASGLSGVLVTASGGFSGNATTDGGGAYTITGVPNGATSILLTPTLAGHTMSPTTLTVAGPVAADVTGEDFTSTTNPNPVLTVLATNGSVTKNPDQPSYTPGTQVTLTPVPDATYGFASWSGDVPVGHESDNPLVVTMDQDRTITANFAVLNPVVTDDFNRANETPLTLGGNWQRSFGIGTANLASNHVVGTATEVEYYWQGPGTFDNTQQFARAKVVQQGGGEVGVLVLGASGQAILASWYSGTVYLYWYINGGWVGNLATAPSTLQAGDIIELQLSSGTLYGRVNGAVVVSAANTTSLTTGRPGFETYQVGGILDDWSGGTVPVPLTRQIDASASAGGTISPSGSVTVSTGASQAFTLTPNASYFVDSLYVDGISVTPTSPYTFTNVQANHTIRATFIFGVAGVGDGTGSPTAFALSPMSPNPASGSTRFEIALPRESNVHVGLHDVQGRELQVLAEGSYSAGRHSLQWSNSGHSPLNPGLYFIRMSVPGHTMVSRFVLVR